MKFTSGATGHTREVYFKTDAKESLFPHCRNSPPVGTVIESQALLLKVVWMKGCGLREAAVHGGAGSMGVSGRERRALAWYFYC